MAKLVPITLDRKRNLKCGVNAALDISQALGLTLEQAVNQVQISNFAAVRAFLWAFLRHEQSELSLDDAGNLLETHIENGGDLEELGLKIAETAAGATWVYQIADKAKKN